MHAPQLLTSLPSHDDYCLSNPQTKPRDHFGHSNRDQLPQTSSLFKPTNTWIPRIKGPSSERNTCCLNVDPQLSAFQYSHLGRD
ncbi:hypothetical protein Hypma_013810 [Hypsizygus marmoreus]|uniref:Uncharacterized protein n=1 Tax=Hypsizygus marmoreus TaxID=39966 RepID=A0A369KE01_HYPMA|nr:hypothetical protein Hypma_013810 [Hypsizygus marmoreus]